MSTVRATRKRNLKDLVELTRGRLRRMLKFGVTIYKIKSGYWLITEDELKQLDVIQTLSKEKKLPRLYSAISLVHVVAENLLK